MRRTCCLIRAWGCVFGMLVMQIVAFTLVLGFPQTTSYMRKCAHEARIKQNMLFFARYSLSSSIAKSQTIMKPSATSISSAVSVGAVALSKWTQRRVCARPTNSKWPPLADKHWPHFFKNASVTRYRVQGIVRAAVMMSAHSWANESASRIIFVIMPQVPKSRSDKSGDCGGQGLRALKIIFSWQKSQIFNTSSHLSG